MGNGKSVISNNTIEGGGYGIQTSNLDYVSDNVIYGCGTGIRAGSGTIERNVIRNNGDGILLWINANPTIQNNTIVNNVNGISLPGYSEGSRINYHNIQVQYNNIYDNSEYNINLYMDGAYPKNDVDAVYNWWGTNDPQAISQKIHDNKNDFNLGTVTFAPFLTAPNPDAPTIPTLTPTPMPTLSPTPTPTVPEFSSWTIPLILTLTLALAGLSFYTKKPFRRKKA
jgi:parallel beta-helix repeat protein